MTRKLTTALVLQKVRELLPEEQHTISQIQVTDPTLLAYMMVSMLDKDEWTTESKRKRILQFESYVHDRSR